MKRLQIVVAFLGMGVAWITVSTVFTALDIPAKIIPSPPTVIQPSIAPSEPPPETRSVGFVDTQSAIESTGTATHSPMLTPTPTATPGASAIPSATPGAAPIPSATPTTTPVLPATPTATSTPLATPTKLPLLTPESGKGIARSASAGGVIVREQPTTKSKMIAGIPTGGRVDVLAAVEGEPIDPAEPRWYQVKYGNTTGYVYFKLIAPEE